MKQYLTFPDMPQGYTVIFWGEVLTNFSFYGFRSILILLLTKRFLMDDAQAIDIYASFMALAYLMPVLGGWLSDRFLGVYSSLVIGGASAALGFFVLTCPYGYVHYGALSLACIGLGFVKPNIVSAVGLLFPKESPLLDKAYTIFYTGMNGGSLIAGVACGFIADYYGWSYIFPLLSLSMLIVTFFCSRFLKDIDALKPPLNNWSEKKSFRFFLWGGILLTFIGTGVLFSYAASMSFLMPFIILGSLGYFLFLIFKSKGQNRRNLYKLLGLLILFAAFCALFEQSGGILTLFIDRSVDRTFFNFTLPTASFQSLNPLFVIFLGSLAGACWKICDKKRILLSSFSKFAVGFVFMALSFVVLSVAIGYDSFDERVGSFWVLISFLIQVIGEFCIIPIGFASVSKLSEKSLVNRLMGIWMIAIAAGHYGAGVLAKLFITPKAGEETIPLSIYDAFFQNMTILSFIPVLVVGVGFAGFYFVKRTPKTSV